MLTNMGFITKDLTAVWDLTALRLDLTALMTQVSTTHICIDIRNALSSTGMIGEKRCNQVQLCRLQACTQFGVELLHRMRGNLIRENRCLCPRHLV